MKAEEFFNNGFGIDVEKVHRKHVIDLMTNFAERYHEEQLCAIQDIIARFSGEERMKLQKHFVELYGTAKMSREKANSFAVGFGKACEMIIKELNAKVLV